MRLIFLLFAMRFAANLRNKFVIAITPQALFAKIVLFAAADDTPQARKRPHGKCHMHNTP